MFTPHGQPSFYFCSVWKSGKEQIHMYIDVLCGTEKHAIKIVV